MSDIYTQSHLPARKKKNDSWSEKNSQEKISEKISPTKWLKHIPLTKVLANMKTVISWLW